MKTILMTGGHAGTTAIATARAFKKRKDKNNYEIVWVGPEYAFEGTRLKTLEFKIFGEMGIRRFGIVSGKLQSKFTRYTLWAAARTPIGFIHAFWLVLRLKPSVILSFGGYAAVPVVVCAWVLGIPVIIHEQVAGAGRGNRLTARFARRIAVSREESIRLFPERKVVVTGNPILEKIARIEPKDKVSKVPELFVTGGSRGARVINRAIEEALERLLTEYRVIHQTGELDYARYEKLRDNLTEKLKKRYEVFSFINPLEMDKIYEKADVVVGRAGANTVSEVLAAGRPAIFIPIPWSKFNEQGNNAEYAREAGMATVIAQRELTPERLIQEIKKIIANWRVISSRGKGLKARFDEGAADRLSEVVLAEMR